jgi:hypothetical protein
MGFFTKVVGKMVFGKMVFGKIYTSDIECEYKSICSSYQNDSHTCKHAVDKSYCGIYNRFL